MPLLTTLYAANYELWQLYQKVTFDPINRLIIINPGVTDINVQIDLYSAAKEWLKLENNLRFRPPMRASGGDPLPGGGTLGRTFFVTNNWRVYVQDSVNIDGNLYSDNFTSPFLNAAGIKLVNSKVSNLVDTVSISTLNIPTATENADAVWNAILTLYAAQGSAGKILRDVEKKTDDNQALIISR